MRSLRCALVVAVAVAGALSSNVAVASPIQPPPMPGFPSPQPLPDLTGAECHVLNPPPPSCTQPDYVWNATGSSITRHDNLGFAYSYVELELRNRGNGTDSAGEWLSSLISVNAGSIYGVYPHDDAGLHGTPWIWLPSGEKDPTLWNVGHQRLPGLSSTTFGVLVVHRPGEPVKIHAEINPHDPYAWWQSYGDELSRSNNHLHLAA